jgi:hypothetical protein
MTKRSDEDEKAYQARRARWVYKVIEILGKMDKWSDARTATRYVEPGYSDPECGVIAFGNWNPRQWERKDGQSEKDWKLTQVRKRAGGLIEYFGGEIEWRDEWCTCDCCGGAVRTQSNGHRWTSSYYLSDDGETTCSECVADDPSGYLEHLEGNVRAACAFDIDLREHDYVSLAREYATGFHYGQSDSPPKVAKELRSIGVERFIFEIADVGQFDCHWRVWVHKDEYRRVKSYARYEKAA